MAMSDRLFMKKFFQMICTVQGYLCSEALDHKNEERIGSCTPQASTEAC